MLPLILVIAGAVLGWLYLLCRVTNRVASLADRYVRLSFVGYGLMLSAPLALVVVTWYFGRYAQGLLGMDWRALGHDPWARAGIGIGWLVLVGELLRRWVGERRRVRALRGMVQLQAITRHSFRTLFIPRSTPRHTVYALASRVIGNYIDTLAVCQYHLRLPGWPATLARLRCVQLTDIHYTHALPRGYYEQVVALTNALAPDLIFLTGDYGHSHGGVRTLSTLLAGLRAPHGVFFTLGNHDVWHDPAFIVATLADQGFTYLGGRMQAVAVAGGPVYLAGTDAPWLRHDVRALVQHVPAGAACIVLSHHPDNARRARGTAARLVLSGHTHGGQIALPGLGPLLVPSAHGSKHASGFVRYDQTLLYVNYGLSLSLPFRLLCPPEIACFDIGGD
ncbi:MAG: metallophosphoesterase [bacterium]|nr:metallophosphoesterase [bacterium]